MSTREVVINPGRQTGIPCLDGTRLPAIQMATHYDDAGADEVLRSYYGIDLEGLAVCCWYAATFESHKKRFRRWRAWAASAPLALTTVWTADMLPPRKETT